MEACARFHEVFFEGDFHFFSLCYKLTYLARSDYIWGKVLC